LHQTLKHDFFATEENALEVIFFPKAIIAGFQREMLFVSSCRSGDVTATSFFRENYFRPFIDLSCGAASCANIRLAVTCVH